MLARVMTFYASSDKIADLVATLRSELPARYGSIPGYRGIVVLEKSAGNHMIAMTLWENEEGIEASEDVAVDNATRIQQASGTAVSMNVYEVVGMGGEISE